MFHSVINSKIKALSESICIIGNKASVTSSLVCKSSLIKSAIIASLLSFASVSAHAAGAAGLFTGGAEELEPLTLSVVEPLAKAPYELESGKYYELIIICDGSGELALSGAEFFRNIWIDEIVINDIEIRPMGISSFEFDDEGEMEISFIAIKPGTYTLRIPGTTGESQQAQFIIR